jgi:uncharacterized damage-inducible protein DinB
MEKLFEACLDLMEKSHNEIHHALEALPPTALDWSPGPEINSISVLVFHITGSERFWIGDVAMQEPSGRDRDAEFAVRGVSKEILYKRLDDSLSYARTAFERLALQDLDHQRLEPPQGRTVTVAWAVLHALEHLALHVGHIELTRQLWEETH